LKGKFITFEGIDGSGKSTQLQMLAADLRSRGADVVTTREPGGTPLGRQLRKAFLETTETVAPMAELLAFAADRAQHVEFLIRPALEAGRIVISDRFADATYAYQGAGRGFPEESVLKVIGLATGGLKPDLTLFLDIPVEMALQRMASRDHSESVKNRMDEETSEFYSRVRGAYLGIAEREPDRFVRIDASGTVKAIHDEVTEKVRAVIGQPAGRVC
jgi:dTMP kinase